ncbi:lysophospholipid acyltransferase family protein [Pseudochelatococcus contaminans]|uniref:1-acyl-sn-glycerol-3-phosphate acyltransferase n=1 Tax=Pseudochelatococcus contaminans TaxID=1538103 RepID=A0A7W6EEF7_9HYPH|nr:lysophospholipid acyltransferase family protein [Pseudochelatococcus contaminans]MBB3808204.1 1-acyl-sn-glycerol-3-phosphate acyltransferase [Pseudochelatococcus contaminans]
MSKFGFYAKIAVLVPVTAVGIPLQWLLLRLNAPGRRIVPMLYHRIVCSVLGIRRIVHGAPPRGKAALILSNHVSWLDICVLSALMPLSFIAKAEVGTWPVVSLLARLQRTVFIDRTRRTDTARTNGAVAERLQAGDAIVLFAEGTTGDGTRVLPFRSALVGAAREALTSESPSDVVLQPLAITYVRRDGLPVMRGDIPDIAWHGDMELAPHLKGVLSGGGIDVQITWGDPIPFDATTDRKAVSRLAEEQVRTHVREALAWGRKI